MNPPSSIRPLRMLALALLLGRAGLTNRSGATTYYVETTGVDGAARAGSISQPWKTLAYAATRVSASGDLIKIGAGTFEESAMTQLKPGVSLDGAGQAKTTITCIANPVDPLKSWLISMGAWNADIPVAGNQTISNLTLDGRAHSVNQAIGCYARSGVTFHDITFNELALNALQITGSNTPLQAANAQWPDHPPPDSAYCTNIQIHDCTFLNSGYNPPTTNWSYGALGLSGVKDSVIRNCVFDERIYGGWGIKGSWIKNSSVHNCSVQVTPTDPVRGKDFSIELWYVENSEFYDIWANGAFSIGMNNNVRIHHNEIVTLPGENMGYAVEFGGVNSSVDHNWFDAVGGVVIWSGPHNASLRVEHNVFRKCNSAIFGRSYNDGGSNYGDFSDLHIYNNTLDNCGDRYNSGPIGLNAQGTGTAPISGSQIRNNIIVNTTVPDAAVELGGLNTNSDLYSANITGTTITNNLFYNNAYGNFNQTASVVGTVASPNTVANPLFKGASNAAPAPYYELQPGSPALGAGADVGLPYLGAAPDLGAFVQPPGQRIEAEMNFSVAAEAGTNNQVAPDNLDLDSNKCVRLADTGDTLRIHFKVLTAGYYDLAARVRSGSWSVSSDTNHNPTGWFPNSYAYQIDGAGVAFAGDAASVSAPDAAGGGVYWGTMNSRGVYLPAGLHHLAIAMSATGGLVDWLEVVKVSSTLEQATAFTWTGATAGSWSDSAKWDANGAPVSDVFFSDVVVNPGAGALSAAVDAAWNTTGSGSIHSLTLQSGTNTLANGAATTNLTIGAGGFTNHSAAAAALNFNTVAGGTLTTAGSQIWATNAQNLSCYGNLAAANATDVLTLDAGTSNNKTILFSGAYTTPYAGTLYFRNTAGTLGTTLTFDTARAGSYDRAAKLVIDNNHTLQNATLNFYGAANGNTIACAIEFRNFAATAANYAAIATNLTGGLTGYSCNNLDFAGNWSGSILGKTAGGITKSALNLANPGTYTLSGDNSALTIDSNDVAHGKAVFALRSGGLVANSPNALGLNNTLGVCLGENNGNTPANSAGLYATPAAGTVAASVWLPANTYVNGQLAGQPGFAQLGLPATAGAGDRVTFTGNLFLETTTNYQPVSPRLVTGMINDASHGGTLIFNGAIQDSGTSYPVAPSTANQVVLIQGAGTVEFNGANTYVCTTTVRGGTLLLGSDAPAVTPVTVTTAAAAAGGAANLTLTGVTGLTVGMPLANAVLNVAPGTRITAINAGAKQVTLSLPTTGAISNNVKLQAGGGALGAAASAVSLGDAVPALVTVKAATYGNNYPANGTWSAGDGVTTFTKWTFGTVAQAGTLDGAAVVTGDAVLVKDCNFDVHRNGVYVVDTAAKTWTRVATLDGSAEIIAHLGMRVHVTHGSQNANKDFHLQPALANPAKWTIDKTANTAANEYGPQAFFADVTQPACAILTNGAHAVGRAIHVTNNQSAGKSTLGGNTADASRFAGLVTLDKPLTLTAAAGGSVDFSGDIAGGFGVTKEGAGTVVFSTAKSYTGATTVTTGALTVNGALASGGVTVGSGATLQGTGTLAGSVTAAGTLAPGTGGATGVLVTGPATLTGTLAVKIAGTSNDMLVSAGALNFSGATLTLALSGAGFTQAFYVIAQGTSLTGAFTSVPPGYAVTYTATRAILSTAAGAAYAAWADSHPFANPGADSQPAADPDGDGLTNFQEFAFGLDPTLGASCNPLHLPFDMDTGTFSYTRPMTSLTGLGYAIQTSTTLGAASWTTDRDALQAVTGTAGDIETVQVTVARAALTNKTLFVRVVAQ